MRPQVTHISKGFLGALLSVHRGFGALWKLLCILMLILAVSKLLWFMVPLVPRQFFYGAPRPIEITNIPFVKQLGPNNLTAICHNILVAI